MHDLCSILLLNFPPTIYWPQSDTGGDKLRGVLNAGDAGFSVVSDPETRKMVCGFQSEVAAAVTDLGGGTCTTSERGWDDIGWREWGCDCES